MSYYCFNRQEKQKKDILKEKSSRVLCTKQRSYKKKSQESVKKTCQKKKKTRLKSTKEKSIKNWFIIKKKR